MTLDTLFLLLVTTYLVLIGYGVVGIGRLAGRARRVAVGLMVVLPPVLIVLSLLASGEGAVVARWGRLFIAMPLAGAGVAFVAERVARRVEGAP